MSLSTHQIGQSSWEDDSRLAKQEIQHSLHKSVVNYTFHNGPPLDCALSQTNPRSKFITMLSILILSSGLSQQFQCTRFPSVFFSDKTYMQEISSHFVHVFVPEEVKKNAETRFSTFTTVEFIWSGTSYAMKYGWEHEKLLARRSPVKASNFAHLTKSFCTPLILHSFRVLFRVTVYRVYKNRCYGNKGSDKLQWNKQAHLGPWHSIPSYQTHRTFQTTSYKML
jgi:hypothetical protein